MQEIDSRVRPVSRRTVVAGVAAGAIAAPLLTLGPHASVSGIRLPRLPGEVSRAGAQVTRIGTPYAVVDVSISGDLARLFVPLAGAGGALGEPQSVVWYHHAKGEDRSALSGAFRRSAELMVDRGAVSICPDFGGDLWVSSRAIEAQHAAARWVKETFAPSIAFGRADTSGAALLAFAYAGEHLPGMRGIYAVNGAFDVEAMYDLHENHVGAPYASDLAWIRATSPTALPPSVWHNKRMRLVASDCERQPRTHGLRLAACAHCGRAAEVTTPIHTGGHLKPASVDEDMVATFDRWAAS